MKNLEKLLRSGFNIVGIKKGKEIYKRERSWVIYQPRTDKIILYYSYIGNKRLILDKENIWKNLENPSTIQ